MGAFYVHNGQRILLIGHCPDGMEYQHSRLKVGMTLVLGPPPCDPLALSLDEEWSIPMARVVKRPVDPVAQWAHIRHRRDQLLAASDWVEMRAVREQRVLEPEWAQYRQALRDVTEQTNPEAIDWPKSPS